MTKQERYRARMRAAGLRPVQIWAPDTRAPDIAAECRRQAERINAAAGTEEDALAFIAAAGDWNEPEASE